MATTANTTSSNTTIPTPTSLLVGLNCRGSIHLIIGTNPLASSRCAQSLAAGALPILIAPAEAELHYALQRRIDDGEVKWERKHFEDEDLFRLGREEVGNVVDAVFVTTGPHHHPQSEHISTLCRRNRIPVNVVDAPHLCTLTLLSTYTDGPLQIGVTTNGRGCKLASRIRREVAASLPVNLGAACARLGEVRRRVQEEDANQASHQVGELDDATGQGAQFNKLVVEGGEDELRTRRMRWLSQVCEYWPLSRLASVGDADVEELFQSYPGVGRKEGPGGGAVARTGRVVLAGSGPGHPDLLTQATHKAIQSADLILADKLVPSGVLDLIPRRTPVTIARKFPGNADLAQQELLDSALDAYRQGKTVLRLKQGDPFIYGRGGEEVAFLRANGVPDDRLVVLPGITSALSAPLFADIPCTQRDVADQVLICTGTGKKGKPPSPPEFVPSRTVVFLMALHRIVGLVRELTSHLEEGQGEGDPAAAGTTGTKRTLYPLETPCAVIERASCPDQRVIRTTLRHVAEAIEAEGSRPPGLLVVGPACEALHKSERGRAWAVEEGFRGLDVGDLGVAAEQLLAVRES
ncbi:Uroporphyrinogen-III C-methyltransferase-like protein [Hapsidospora chrysogenum ATCC 11550]|uniref:Uroporphyrinogen-III C-methyltransferase-like protein n=1 Tax=Hapsidospora chrysogenum (strain ATCC 11550 / CBS 779.69 / DSM 880 / IAM 14645 / JCM 23072 / IMI 49137) TaxID=857340 RepID=A0A086T0H3_HAPC1|nr:Uroporphyrinogen-III C-methyltransferase-like protein [Hapsidospora chrysogenum ATCC 11550]